MTSASRRIAIAAVAIALVAAACGGFDPGDDAPSTIAEPEASPTHETLKEGGKPDTADYHGDPDISDDNVGDTADHHDTDGEDTDDDTADHHDTDGEDTDDDTADHHDTDGEDTDDDTADHHDTDGEDTDDDTADHHDTDGEEDTGSTAGADHHGSADAPTRYDADVADAEQTVSVEVVGGEPVGGHQRVEVGLGSVVAVTVTADTAEEVHVHGYGILRAVSNGHPARFAFTAEIPGVFEVELEGSGRLLLLLLEIS